MSLPHAPETAIRFTKMHGIGNDYVYIDCLQSQPTDPGRLAVAMSERHTGVGADGIILICPSHVADFRMRIFNADGSEAKMCGNGSRCVARYVYEHGLTRKTRLTLETLAGIRTLQLNFADDDPDEIESVTVDMGQPVLSPHSIPVTAIGQAMIDAEVHTSRGPVKMTAVSMGNPHGVVWVDDTDATDVTVLGPELERHPMWPDRANIEFVQIISPSRIKMRVWERGSGETMACGTGACAAAVAAAISGRCRRSLTADLPGGSLRISWNSTDGRVYMTGGATTVFHGTYTPPKNI